MPALHPSPLNSQAWQLYSSHCSTAPNGLLGEPCRRQHTGSRVLRVVVRAEKPSTQDRPTDAEKKVRPGFADSNSSPLPCAVHVHDGDLLLCTAAGSQGDDREIWAGSWSVAGAISLTSACQMHEGCARWVRGKVANAAPLQVFTNKDPVTGKSKGEQAKDLLKKYGSAYLITSISFAIVSFAACYALVSSGVRCRCKDTLQLLSYSESTEHHAQSCSFVCMDQVCLCMAVQNGLFVHVCAGCKLY